MGKEEAGKSFVAGRRISKGTTNDAKESRGTVNCNRKGRDQERGGAGTGNRGRKHLDLEGTRNPAQGAKARPRRGGGAHVFKRSKKGGKKGVRLEGKERGGDREKNKRASNRGGGVTGKN